MSVHRITVERKSKTELDFAIEELNKRGYEVTSRGVAETEQDFKRFVYNRHSPVKYWARMARKTSIEVKG